jgi:hypothetical protein
MPPVLIQTLRLANLELAPCLVLLVPPRVKLNTKPSQHPRRHPPNEPEIPVTLSRVFMLSDKPPEAGDIPKWPIEQPRKEAWPEDMH